MTEAKYEELLELALGNQRLAQENHRRAEENHRLALVNQTMIAKCQVEISKGYQKLIEVADNQSRRLDRVESL